MIKETSSYKSGYAHHSSVDCKFSSARFNF